VLRKTLVLLFSFNVVCFPLWAQTGKKVIPQGFEGFFLDVFKEPLGKVKGKAPRLRGIEIAKDRVKAVYEVSGKRQEVFLVQPEEGKARTKKFGIVAPEDFPSNLLNAIVRKVEQVEEKFDWRVEQDMAVSQENGKKEPENGRYLPRFPKEASLVEVGKGVRVSMLTEDAAKEIAKARAAIGAKEFEKARKIAKDVASRWMSDANCLRASASVLRAANSPKEALELLKGLNGEALVETAATYLLLGERDSARDAIKKSGARDPDCTLADALLVLVQDGLVREAQSLAKDVKGDKRCIYFLRLKLAMAIEDEKAIDRNAQDLLSQFQDDEDALYVWGLYYYMHKDLKKAIVPWLRLVEKNYKYPAVLGQLGSAMLTAGMLGKNELPKYLKKACEDENDIVWAFLAGVGSYYQHDYKTVVPLLSRVAKAVPDESRAKLYLAMSYYFLDNRAEAERIFEELEPYAYHDPDIYYCRSLIYRARDLPRAIREMEKFLEVFVGENRLSFGPEKVEKAKSDLQRMKRGEIPELNLPGQDLIPAK
jgi:tetratricopeptide (TPR) repeat protein